MLGIDDLDPETRDRLLRMAAETKAAIERKEAQDEHVRQRIKERLRGEPAGRWYALFCRVCDPGLETPMPFPSAEARGRWAGAHTRETGHDRWHCPDYDKGTE